MFFIKSAFNQKSWQFIYKCQKIISIHGYNDKRIALVCLSLAYPVDAASETFWLVDSWTEILALRKFSLSKQELLSEI